eukprot:g36565.t1
MRQMSQKPPQHIDSLTFNATGLMRQISQKPPKHIDSQISQLLTPPVAPLAPNVVSQNSVTNMAPISKNQAQGRVSDTSSGLGATKILNKKYIMSFTLHTAPTTDCAFEASPFGHMCKRCQKHRKRHVNFAASDLRASDFANKTDRADT